MGRSEVVLSSSCCVAHLCGRNCFNLFVADSNNRSFNLLYTEVYIEDTSGYKRCYKKSIMRTTLFIFGLFFMNVQTFAQQNGNPCPCSLLLGEAIQKVSTIYAGFDDKVTVQTRPAYNQMVSRLRKQVADITSERGCYEIIKQYADWFKDGHVSVWYGVQSSASELPTVPLDKARRLLKPNQNSIEGMWATADQTHQYAIIKDPSHLNKFIAVTIKSSDSAWKPGMVKAEFYGYDVRNQFYRGMYYQTNFNGMLNGFTLHHNRLDHWYGPSWYRKDAIDASKEAQPENVKSVQFKVLNKDFVYLKLGRFMQGEVNEFDSIVRANRPVIYGSKNLIIDLRGNPGGDASSSQEMIQLIYTNPIIYPAWQYRSSPELIKVKKAGIDRLLNNDPYNRLKSQQVLLQRLEEHPGGLVSSGDSIVRTVDSVSRYPERVAFLIDGGSGSSAEFFTFEGKQSKKVTLFGANTAGVMDYGEAQSLNLPCGQYIIGIPWGRNGWIKRFGFRVDNVGFNPDVRIPATERDWVQFVMKYWSR